MGFVLPHNVVELDEVLEAGVVLGALVGMVAAAVAFGRRDRSTDDQDGAPNRFRLLLICTSLAFLLMLSMFGIA